ncbi:MAG TPA: protein phosphatase 2C domain-containing protein [Vicinamibacterales bacterium]|nr:protein phosphatase 2C domain-containing protein [Vicinamibacterales bacterium]
MRFSAHGTTHPGRRSSNEDAFFVDVSLGLFIVADGMGGHNAGEVAAHLAIETISEFIRHTHQTDPTWPYGFDPALSLEGNRVSSSLRLANDRVRQAADSRIDCAGMGTTVVVSLVTDGRIVFGGVGDSRLYMWHEGALQPLTQDDSWVAMVLAREPGMTETALAQHPMRHVLTNVVGAKPDMDPKVAEQAVSSGDVLLLCSDGLHGVLTADAIGSMLGSNRTAEQIANDLLETAIAQGAKDNVTAVVVRCDK